MYILKTKGTAKIADYVQVRDEHFALVKHLKLSEIEKFFRKEASCCGEDALADVHNLPFGKLTKLSIQ
jgi:hypothetical protein